LPCPSLPQRPRDARGSENTGSGLPGKGSVERAASTRRAR
jgi:hypothetical protein